ncbi:MAG TPA: DsrE family protein [Candidatus Binatia bacterium]
MAKFLFIESRDPFDNNDVAFYGELACNLVREGNDVTMFLVQNGVLPTRRCEQSARLTYLAQVGVKVLADEFSLRERGITVDSMIKAVTAAPLDIVVDELAGGTKTIWH